MGKRTVRVRKKDAPTVGSGRLLRTSLESYARKEQLTRLILSNYDTAENMNYELERVGIQLNDEDYMVWLIRRDSPQPKVAIETPERREMNAIASETIGRAFNCAVFHAELGAVCIIGTKHMDSGAIEFVDDPKGFNAKLEVTANEIVQLCAERFGHKAFVYMGRPHPGLRGVAESYTDVNNILNYCHLLNNVNPIVQYIDFELMQRSSPKGHRSLQLVKAYISSVERQNYTSASAAIMSLVDYEFINNPVPETVTLRLYAIYYLLLNTLEQAVEPPQELTDALIDSMSARLTLPDIKTKIDSVFDYISDYSRRAEESNQPTWLKLLIQFVDENSQDSNLSVNNLAHKFGLTPSYMTKVVKKHVGIGLFEYIQRKRLENAISLIGAGKTMTSIAKQAGFSDLRAMRRAFQKFEDATPSRFTDCTLM